MIKNRRKPTPAKPDTPAATHFSRQDFHIAVLLLLATLAVFSQVRSYEFVSLDDPVYISANPNVRAGLSSESMVWAFTTNRDGNWFPLTWLSHMLVYQFFGPQSGFHHLANVLLHILSTLLLFALFRRMTGSSWRSAFVACLFALHPLHVESVAWVSERKDVLCGFFWILAIWGYLHYVERPRPGSYLLVLVPFCLGLMSKAMIITLPFVLLLLDVWPLRRIRLAKSPLAGKPNRKAEADRKARSVAAIFWEKVPLLALSAAMSVVTYKVQQSGGAVVSTDWIPFGTRLGNALISYLAYVAQMVWPVRLSVFYPYPMNLPGWQVAGAAVVLAAITILALHLLRRLPYMAVGWFWYLGTLVPVIGLIQVGMQSQADRYTYFPLIGISILAAWGVPDLLHRWPGAKFALACSTITACSACTLLTWYQIQVWQNSTSLYQHALRATPGSHMGHYGMGGVLRNQGRLEEAIPYYVEAIRLAPRLASAHGGLGGVLLSLGRVDEAIAQFSEAIRLHPDSIEDHINLGIALSTLGKVSDAIARFQEAIRINPGSANAHYNLGRAYANAGNVDEALAQFNETIRLQPDNAEAHYNLGSILAGQGRLVGAVEAFNAAIRIRPDYASAHNNLGGALAQLGKIDEAITHFTEALHISPDFVEARRNLENALTLRDKPPKR
jgi:tetratricopeptide (TPR) repeat protein